MISFPSLGLGNLLASAPRAPEVMTGVWELSGTGTPKVVAGACSSGARGGRGWGVEKRVLGQPLHHPPLCAPLNNGASLLWWDGLLARTALVIAIPHSSPFRLSLSSQLKSSPQVCPLNPKFQLPATICASGCASQAGTRRMVDQIAWAGLCPLCLNKPVAAFSSEPLKLPFCPCFSPHWLRELSRAWEIDIFPALFQGYKSYPASSFYFSFTRCGYVEIFLILPGIWGLYIQ